MNLISYEYDENGNSVNNTTKSATTSIGTIVIIMVLIIASYFLAKAAPLLIKKA